MDFFLIKSSIPLLKTVLSSYLSKKIYIYLLFIYFFQHTLIYALFFCNLLVEFQAATYYELLSTD